MRSQSQKVSALGLSPVIFVLDTPRHADLLSSVILPGILVTLSPGASLTYNVEVTGLQNPVNAPGELWNVADNGGSLSTNVNLTLTGAVAAIRLNVTAYTSGFATIILIQP